MAAIAAVDAHGREERACGSCGTVFIGQSSRCLVPGQWQRQAVQHVLSDTQHRHRFTIIIASISISEFSFDLGADMDLCLTEFGHCNFVSAKHATIFYDEVCIHRCSLLIGF